MCIYEGVTIAARANMGAATRVTHNGDARQVTLRHWVHFESLLLCAFHFCHKINILSGFIYNNFPHFALTLAIFVVVHCIPQ